MVSTLDTILRSSRTAGIIALLLLPTAFFAETRASSDLVIEVSSPTLGKEEVKAIADQLGISVGESLNLDKIDAGVRQLSDRFQSLRIESEQRKTGVAVTIRGVIARTIREIRFQNIDGSILDEAKAQMSLPDGPITDPRVITVLKDHIKAAYQDRGYLFADVSVKTIETKEGIDLVVEGIPNQPTIVSKVGIQGGVKGLELDDQILLRRGDRFTQVELEKSAENIQKYLKDNQYPTSKIDETVVNFSEDKLRVDVTFVLKVGNKYQFEFVGNTAFNEVVLRELITEEILAQSDPGLKIAGLIQDKYRAAGFHFARVQPENIRVEEEKLSIIRFKIEEESRVIIDRIEFGGDLGLSQGELVNIMFNAAPGVLKRRVYWEDGIPEMVSRFLKRLEKMGFQKPSVNGPRTVFSEDGKGVQLFFDLELGIQSFVASIDVQGNRTLPKEEIVSAFGLALGSPYDPEQVAEGKSRVSDLYKRNGFLEAKVNEGAGQGVFLSVDEQKNRTVRLTIDEGPRYYVGDISLDGNRKTADKVIFREMKLRSGDVFNPFLLRQSEENIYVLGLFSRVEMLTLERKGEPTKKDIKIIVVEMRPGSGEIGFGGAYEDPRFRIRNFLSMNYRNIAGTNQTVSSRAELVVPFSYRGAKSIPFLEYGLTVGYRAPYPFDVPVIFAAQAGLDGYEVSTNSTGTESSLQYRARIEERLEKRLSSVVTAIYRLHHFERTTTEDRNFNNDPPTTTKLVTNNIGSTGPGLIFDLRDDVFNPVSGSYHTADLEFAHPALLSDANVFFLMTTLRNSFYVPLPDPFQFAIYAGGAYAKSLNDSPIPQARLTNDLALGGISSIRGYSTKKFRADDNASEAAYYNVRGELTLKLYGMVPNLSLAVFLDSGQIFHSLRGGSWQTNPRHDGYGIGLRYKTPVGPLVVDFAQGVGDAKENVKFSLTVGTF